MALQFFPFGLNSEFSKHIITDNVLYFVFIVTINNMYHWMIRSILEVIIVVSFSSLKQTGGFLLFKYNKILIIS